LDRLSIVLDNYLFDFTPLTRLEQRPSMLLLEAPQGFVRLLPRLAGFLSRRLGVEARYRLEPSYGLCSASLSLLEQHPGAVLVHVGHDYYPYPYCGLGGCRYRLPSRVVTVPGLYLGGDAGSLAEKAVQHVGRGSVVAVGFSTQHRTLASTLAESLRRRGVEVALSEPLLGCYFAPFVKAAGRVDAFLVVAGGMFHALGLGLALRGEARLYRADPYLGGVEDVGGYVGRVLAKRLWLIHEFRARARRVAVLAGLLPGQHRPGVVEATAGLLERKGIEYDIVYVERLSRELLDNLDPASYDSYIVTSCPRLAVEDLGDYWKPVLTPGEALAALLGGEYRFPW